MMTAPCVVFPNQSIDPSQVQTGILKVLVPKVYIRSQLERTRIVVNL